LCHESISADDILFFPLEAEEFVMAVDTAEEFPVEGGEGNNGWPTLRGYNTRCGSNPVQVEGNTNGSGAGKLGVACIFYLPVPVSQNT
jgi:hypothetical protein